jgi:hypothetical protein
MAYIHNNNGYLSVYSNRKFVKYLGKAEDFTVEKLNYLRKKYETRRVHRKKG